MAWERESLNTIHGRMKADAEARVTNGVTIPRFSLLGVILIVVSGAIHLVYGFLAFLARQLFLDTAEAEYLDRKARSYGLPRKATGTTDIQSNTSGAVGNTDETTLQLTTPIAGVESETLVTTQPNGGQDRETDDQLRARLLQRTQNPPASGSDSDYVRWATSVEGVSRAWTLAAEDYQGAGSVGVIIADGNLDPVGSTVHQNVEDYIATVRPVTASPDVIDVITSLVKYTVSITPNVQEIRDAITQQTDTYLLASSDPGGKVLISGIRAAITSGGAADYVITAMEKDGNVIAPVGDIDLDFYEVAKLDFFEFSTL